MGETKRRRKAPFTRRMRNAGILPSVIMVLVVLVVVAAALWIVFTRLLRDAWPWDPGGLDTSTPGFQTTQLVLTLVGGLGAAILVVVAYRRQRDLELARFDERFAAAAAQLGASTAAERLAGVYAMAALADLWEIHRQQCIDVLCGYLRLPYDPNSGQLRTVTTERTWPAGTALIDGRGPMATEARTYEHLPNDREVRLTIINTITSHLRADSPTPWHGHNFAFTGATFDGGHLFRAKFTGGWSASSGRSSPAAGSASSGRSSPAARSSSTGRSSPAARSSSTGRSSPAARSTLNRRSSPAARSTSPRRRSGPASSSTSPGRSSPAP